MNNNYENLSDTTLAALTKNGDEAAFEEIIIRYIKLINTLAANYRSDGYEFDDFVQEGMLAFLIACKTYDETKEMSFKNYAVKCTKNRFSDILKKGTKKSAVPNKDIVPMEALDEKEDELNVEDYVLEREYLKTMLKHLDNLLSADERKVFRMYARGYSYSEIAEEMHTTPKKIDNMLQKIKKKLRQQ